MEATKSFDIPKSLIWEAYKRVKANKGSAGVDDESLSSLEIDLSGNLYKIWNRMSSGSYFPPPVKRVEIPKADGKTRPLGIPTVSDRIAQMVVKLLIEPELEKHFIEDSYGYRPEKSALDAIGIARARCWKYNWVVDIDIQGFFDNINHDLLMKAVCKHIKCKWIILYIERWLKAPVEINGKLEKVISGTPQGGVVSPLLANLFLHYALDKWVNNNFPIVKFERYADDVIYHCHSREMATALKAAIENRLSECKLKLHPEKSKIVYCKDDKRKGNYENTQFDFLGYTFRTRLVRAKRGKFFVGFTPAMSNKAHKRVSDQIRCWKLHLWSSQTLESMADLLNPKIMGWLNYYGKYNKSSTYKITRQIDFALARWAKRKYKKLKSSYKKARSWLGLVKDRQPHLFSHWNIASRQVVQ